MRAGIEWRLQKQQTCNHEEKRDGNQHEHHFAPRLLITNHPACRVNNERRRAQRFLFLLCHSDSTVADSWNRRKLIHAAISDLKSSIKSESELLTNESSCFHPGSMKKVKAKSRARKTSSASTNVGKRVPYEKAALRSSAFARATTDAKSYTTDPELLRKLLEEAARKVATIPKEPFKDNWPYLLAILRLVRAYGRQQYRDISEDALLSSIVTLSYLVDPFDLIPDEVPFLGFVDDATVVAFGVTQTKQTLDEFMVWETTAHL